MTAARDEHGRIVFDDAETAEAWVGDAPDERAVGCPDCHQVHGDGDALAYCDTGQALPLTNDGRRWRTAPDHLALAHLNNPAATEPSTR